METDLRAIGSKTFGEVIGMYFNEAWYFDKWYEKAIMVGLSVLGLWKIVGWFI